MSNEMKPIALGADHAGFSLKEELRRHLEEQGIPYRDFGSYDGERCDYPDKAVPPCEAVVHGDCSFAVLSCGTGICMAMCANKVPGIRACSCSDSFSAEFTRRHNDANVLCLGARVVGPGLACQLLDLFLDAPFEGGRHQDRVAKVNALDARRG